MPLKLLDARGQRLEFRALTVAIHFKLGQQGSEGGTEQADHCPSRTANHAPGDTSASRWRGFVNPEWCQWWFPGRITQTREQFVGVGSGAQ